MNIPQIYYFNDKTLVLIAFLAECLVDTLFMLAIIREETMNNSFSIMNNGFSFERSLKI
jgi:energy-converting hydrogenase Eha subunit E